MLAEARGKLESRKLAARPDFDKWLASAKPESLAGLVPSDGLKLHARLSEGSGSTADLAVDGQIKKISLGSEAGWAPGHVGAQAYKARPKSGLEVADAGDFDKGQAFSYGAWVKLPKDGLVGSILARMDDQNGYRGWDLWIEGNRPAAHIINRWSDDALKVVARNPIKTGDWTHVFVVYDGSGKASGVSIYLDGKLQEKDIQVDALKNTIRTKVPFKLAQRHTGSRLDDIEVEDLRVYARALPGAEVDRVARTTRALWLLGLPADKRSDADRNELYAWWLPALDKPFGEFTSSVAKIEQDEAEIKARATIAHVMQEKGEAAEAFLLFRGEYDKRREKVTPSTPAAFPPMPADLPRNRLGFAQWLLRPEHPLTARVTREIGSPPRQELFGMPAS